MLQNSKCAVLDKLGRNTELRQQKRKSLHLRLLLYCLSLRQDKRLSVENGLSVLIDTFRPQDDSISFDPPFKNGNTDEDRIPEVDRF